MKFFLCIDGAKTWLRVTAVQASAANTVTFTLDFQPGQTLTIDANGNWTAAHGQALSTQGVLAPERLGHDHARAARDRIQ